jgi:hypothetical protein
MAANKSIIIEDGIAGEAIDRTVGEHGGNFGSSMLAKNAEKLKAALAQIKLDKDE